MGAFAAKQGDQVVGEDVHIVLVPSPTGAVPTPTPLPFSGTITGGCSTDVLIQGAGAAVVGSVATNEPPHTPPTGQFKSPPTNDGRVVAGSAAVLVNGKPLARHGDTVLTCNDPAPAPTSRIVAPSGRVLAG